MTERERRAKGLPSTPAQLELAERLQKDVEMQIAPMAAHVATALKSMEPALTAVRQSYLNMRPSEPIMFIAPSPRHVERVIERIVVPASDELMYDWEDQSFSRRAMGQKFHSCFENGEDNKRRRLVEKLLSTRRYTATGVLASLLTCTEKQIGNLIATVNDKIMTELALKEPLINSRRGSGYRINPEYSIFQKK